mgnify:CR=1 FL=1
MDVEMKSKNYTYFSERSYTGKDCKIDDKVVDYWKKVLGDNVFNNIEKEMCGLEWGRLYELYYKQAYDPSEVQKKINQLYLHRF